MATPLPPPGPEQTICRTPGPGCATARCERIGLAVAWGIVAALLVGITLLFWGLP